MAISDQMIDQAFEDLKKTCGGVRNDYFGLLYLEREFSIDRDIAINQVAFGGNDYGFDQIFVRQIEALGREGDIAIAINTSGDSANVLAAAACARSKRLKTIALTGNCGGALAGNVDVAIVISSRNTARIQECHITIGHLLCELVETDLLDTQLKTEKCSVNRSSLTSDAE